MLPLRAVPRRPSREASLVDQDGIMNYARAIRIARTARDLTQRQLATRVSLDPTYICMIETGKRAPSPAKAEQIMAALNVPPNLFALLGADPDELRGLKSTEAESLARDLLSLLVGEPATP
jgi:transcriptional regulator with XRE-family HTH domain